MGQQFHMSNIASIVRQIANSIHDKKINAAVRVVQGKVNGAMNKEAFLEAFKEPTMDFANELRREVF